MYACAWALAKPGVLPLTGNLSVISSHLFSLFLAVQCFTISFNILTALMNYIIYLFKQVGAVAAAAPAWVGGSSTRGRRRWWVHGAACADWGSHVGGYAYAHW